jgi:hypothetical protein
VKEPPCCEALCCARPSDFWNGTITMLLDVVTEFQQFKALKFGRFYNCCGCFALAKVKERLLANIEIFL